MIVKDVLDPWRWYLSILVLILCCYASYKGIEYAVYLSGCEGDAGRGGAIADALALAFLFLGQSQSARLFHLLSKRKPTADQTERPLNILVIKSIVNEEIENLMTALNSDSKGQRWQNGFLAAGTSIGTLAWGFGDLVARECLKTMVHHPTCHEVKLANCFNWLLHRIR